MALLLQGVKVVVHYNSSYAESAKLKALAPEQISLVRGDLTAPGVAERVVDEAVALMGGLDGLINNAGAMLGRVKTTEASTYAIENTK